jgi:hypothetical protein
VRAFRHDDGAYRAALDPGEGPLLASLVDGLLERVAGAGPQDAVLGALLPPASRDDEEVAAEFRRLAGGDVLDAKNARLVALRDRLAAGDELVVPDDEAWATAGALTDVRLALAVALEVRTDDDATALDDRFGDDDPRAELVLVYEALGWWQETLVHVLVRRAEPGPSRPGAARG